MLFLCRWKTSVEIIELIINSNNMYYILCHRKLSAILLLCKKLKHFVNLIWLFSTKLRALFHIYSWRVIWQKPLTGLHCLALIHPWVPGNGLDWRNLIGSQPAYERVMLEATQLCFMRNPWIWLVLSLFADRQRSRTLLLKLPIILNFIHNIVGFVL